MLLGKSQHRGLGGQRPSHFYEQRHTIPFRYHPGFSMESAPFLPHIALAPNGSSLITTAPSQPQRWRARSARGWMRNRNTLPCGRGTAELRLYWETYWFLGSGREDVDFYARPRRHARRVEGSVRLINMNSGLYLPTVAANYFYDPGRSTVPRSNKRRNKADCQQPARTFRLGPSYAEKRSVRTRLAKRLS